MNNKPFTNYNEQLNLLESRGIDLSTSDLKGRAKRYLQHEGYYNLINGYKYLFLEKGTDGQVALPERYKEGTTVDEIYSLCMFDKRLRMIFLKQILSVETNIKNLIAYEFSKNHNENNYLIIQNFDTSKKNAIEKITGNIASIHRQISDRSGDPSISHYLSNYGYVPLWVLSHILTFGMIGKFYSIMIQSERQAIAKVLKLREEDLISMINYVSSVRNICAHGNRLYCYRTKKPLADLEIHKDLCIPRSKKGEYLYGKRDLFGCVLALKMLLPRNDFRSLTKQINNELRSLRSRLKILNEQDILEIMGFPDDWRTQLERV